MTDIGVSYAIPPIFRYRRPRCFESLAEQTIFNTSRNQSRAALIRGHAARK